MDDGELLIRWSIRICLVFYTAFLAGGVIARYQTWRQLARALWSMAGALFVVHVIAAMHYYHGWSHAHAFEDTARQTRELLGAEFGYGIYFSYLFGVIWVADIAWMWLAGAAYYQQLPVLRSSIHAYMLFIALNGAIIFHSGLIRWAGLSAIAIVAVLAAVTWLRSRQLRDTTGAEATAEATAEPSQGRE